MENYESPITVLNEDLCWNLLAGAEVGRLATAVDGSPEIFPVNFVLDGESIIFRTAEGNKLLELTMNDKVAFEIDKWNEEDGASVIVVGTAAKVTDPKELALMDKLPLRPWVPTVKTHYIRITPERITGRRFQFGEEPEIPQV